MCSIDPGGLSLPQPFPFDQVDLFQFIQQPADFPAAAAEVLADGFDRIEDEHPPLRIPPAAALGKTHAVEQKTVEQLGVDADGLKFFVFDKRHGDAEKGKLPCLPGAEIIVHGNLLLGIKIPLTRFDTGRSWLLQAVQQSTLHKEKAVEAQGTLVAVLIRL